MATYRLARDGLEYGAPQSLTRTLFDLSAKASQWGPKYRVKPSVRDEWSRDLTRPEMMLKAAAAMRKAAWGGLVKVEVGTNRAVSATFLIKKLAPPPPDPLRFYTGNVVNLAELNDRVAKVAEYAKRKAPRVQCSGGVFTRTVDGTSTWSQHSRFPTRRQRPRPHLLRR